MAVWFPVIVGICWCGAAALLFTKGHAVVYWLRQIVGPNVSDRTFYIALAALLMIAAAIFVLYVMREVNRTCRIEEYLYCGQCNSADEDNTGLCPMCSRKLFERAGFLYVTDSKEKERLNRRGLIPCATFR